jgi:hypothetical protein
MLTVVDRGGLEEAACSCYESLKGDYSRMLGKLT